MKNCTIDGCTRIYRARGYCSTHYYREFTSGKGANSKTIYDARPAILEGSVAKIPLGKHGVNYTIVDAEFSHLDKHKWSLDHYGYAVGFFDGKHIKLHQLIIGKKEGYDIDHISRDKLDNRMSNLRHVTHKTNTRNTGMFKHNRSGVKGISWDSARNRWSAKIQVDGVTVNLGRFDDLKEAAKVRSDAEAKYWETISKERK